MNKEDLKDIPFIKLSSNYFTYNDIKHVLNPFIGRRSKKPEYLIFIREFGIDDHAALTTLRKTREGIERCGLHRFIAKRVTSNQYKHFLVDYGLCRGAISAIKEFASSGAWNFETKTETSFKITMESVAIMNWFDNNALTC